MLEVVCLLIAVLFVALKQNADDGDKRAQVILNVFGVMMGLVVVGVVGL